MSKEDFPDEISNLGIHKPPKPVERRRTGNSKPQKGGLLQSLIGSDNLEITIKIPEEDKEALVSSVKEMADKMDFRWKRTQQLIIIGYVMTSCSFIISKLL